MKQGWKYMKLGEIATTINGLWKGKKEPFVNVGVIRNTNFTKDITLDFSKIEYLNVEAKQYQKRKLQKGDLIVEKSGGSEKQPVGRTVLFNAEGEFSVSNFTSILRINNQNEITPEFLYKYLLYVYREGWTKEMQNATTGIHNIIFEKFLAISTPIPPLSDQQRIVSYLDAEFAKIEALKANAEKQLQAAKDLFQAALKELLTPKEGWGEKKLGEVGNICGRIGFRGYTTKDMVSGPNDGAITLSPSNIQDGAMDYTKCQYISWYKYEESPEIMVQNGDVLIVKTGSSYGKSAIVDKLPHKATINPQSVVIKNIQINNRLFAYLIRTPWVQNDFDNFVAGTAIPTFSQANLSKVLLAFPKETDEQQRIADRLDALSANVKALQTNYTETITLCNDLKQALLKKVFG